MVAVGDHEMTHADPGESSTTDAGGVALRRSSWHRPELVRRGMRAVAMLVAPAAYLVFVLRDSVDVPFWDEWSVIPIVNAGLHHSLTFSMLWAQHSENRMLFPNIIFVLFGRFDHYDDRSILLVSAVIYIVGYWLFIALWKAYAQRPASITAAILVGLVWFSFEDWENALWSFQIAWILIVVLLMVMLFALSRAKIRWWHTAVAIVVAGIASFCSLQGLVLWAVGLVCLAWRIKGTRRRLAFGAAWIAAGALATGLYCIGFTFKEGGNSGAHVALAHPVQTARYFFTLMGDVIPTTAPHLGMHEVIGAAIFAVSIWVVYRSIRERHPNPTLPLPTALVLFGLGFDISTALGRTELGIPQALSSRYTLANLLVVAGIAAYFLRPVPLRAHHQRSARVPALVATTIVVLALVAQVVIADHYGWTEGQTTRGQRVLAARTVVNLSEASRAAEQLRVSEFVYPSLTDVQPWLEEARADHLSAFYPPVARSYHRMGFPFNLPPG